MQITNKTLPQKDIYFNSIKVGEVFRSKLAPSSIYLKVSVDNVYDLTHNKLMLWTDRHGPIVEYESELIIIEK